MSNSIPSSLDKSTIEPQMPMANSSAPLAANPLLAAGLSFKHKQLIVSVLTSQLKDYDTYIGSCERFTKDKKNDFKYWSKQLKIAQNKKKLATEIITEFTLK